MVSIFYGISCGRKLNNNQIIQLAYPFLDM